MARCGCSYSDELMEFYPCPDHEEEGDRKERMHRLYNECCDEAAQAFIDALPGHIDGVTCENIRSAVKMAAMAWLP